MRPGYHSSSSGQKICAGPRGARQPHHVAIRDNARGGWRGGDAESSSNEREMHVGRGKAAPKHARRGAEWCSTAGTGVMGGSDVPGTMCVHDLTRRWAVRAPPVDTGSALRFENHEASTDTDRAATREKGRRRAGCVLAPREGPAPPRAMPPEPRRHSSPTLFSRGERGVEVGNGEANEGSGCSRRCEHGAVGLWAAGARCARVSSRRMPRPFRPRARLSRDGVAWEVWKV
jgi:hypothetical protein